MHIVYIIQHNETYQLYFGQTNNLKRRLHEHNNGEQKATRRKSGSWILIYAEAYRNKEDAVNRELTLKQHGSNKRWLKARIQQSLLKS
jgi:putative endonuclease